jgi:uncharacterized RDD family membrane protein YckC
MTCGYCGNANGSGESRCLRCGRRLDGSLRLVSEPYGNTVPKPEPLPDPYPEPEIERKRGPIQGKLFPMQEPKRVIPFESISPAAAQGVKSTQQRNANARSKRRYEERLGLDTDSPREFQKELSFPEDRPVAEKVEPSIYTDSPVAMPAHRAMAVAYDSAMVLIAIGLLLTIVYVAGGRWQFRQTDLVSLGVLIAGVTAFYKLLWAIANTDTPGMRAVHLRLVNFDGRQPRMEDRLLRFFSSVVSLMALGAGMVWCLFEEEKLTWHDLITRTFPTPALDE